MGTVLEIILWTEGHESKTVTQRLVCCSEIMLCSNLNARVVLKQRWEKRLEVVE